MTSSVPLAHGGFDLGVFNRPQSLSHRLAEAGHGCHVLTFGHWVNSVFGYNDGTDHQELPFHPAKPANALDLILRRGLHEAGSAERL